MDNPEKLATMCTPDTGRIQTKQKTHHMYNMCWTPRYANKHNNVLVNKSCVPLRTTGGKDEPNIIFLAKLKHNMFRVNTVTLS